MLPGEGSINTKNYLRPGKEGFYIIAASYTDMGRKTIKPLSANAKEVLRFYKLYPEDLDRISDMVLRDHKLAGLGTGYATIKDIDLSGIKETMLRASGYGGSFVIRIDSLNGDRIATFQLNPAIKEMQQLTAIINPVQGKHDFYLVHENRENRFQNMSIEWIYFK